MTLTQQSAPYAHWEFVHPETGDRLRIIPERGGIVRVALQGARSRLFRPRALRQSGEQHSRRDPGAVSDLWELARGSSPG